MKKGELGVAIHPEGELLELLADIIATFSAKKMAKKMAKKEGLDTASGHEASPWTILLCLLHGKKS